MRDRPPPNEPTQRYAVVMPTWLGDCVMATPTLRALRELYPEARLVAVVGPAVRPILEHLPTVDDLLPTRRGALGLAAALRSERFDAAVLLPNSFKAALAAWLAGIPRRVGYERDGRGMLLTDRLVPRHDGKRFVPVPTLDYYLGLARYLGAADPPTHMELASSPEEQADADALLQRAGWDPAGSAPLVLLNPGAQKPVKRWPADRFGQLADRLTTRCGATVAVTGSPAEAPVLHAVCAAAREPVINLAEHGLTLALLKAVTRRAALMVTNDTGPRHIAAAVDTPVVSLFGPTDPAWTEIAFQHERRVIAPDITDPTPADRRHFISAPRRMDQIPLEAVFEAAAALLAAAPRPVEARR
jgi:heptosyltransferase-2